MAAPLSVQLEFGGGAELLFDGVRKHQVNLPGQSEPWNLRHLLMWIKENLLKERPELFVQGESVRPGILVLINDADWELMVCPILVMWRVSIFCRRGGQRGFVVSGFWGASSLSLLDAEMNHQAPPLSYLMPTGVSSPPWPLWGISPGLWRSKMDFSAFQTIPCVSGTKDQEHRLSGSSERFIV
uniref:Ubiquitin-related modifier 1 n=1 Tax=Naja naja TaxID=35670 RepID=A0A8C7E7N3_NAJNA